MTFLLIGSTVIYSVARRLVLRIVREDGTGRDEIMLTGGFCCIYRVSQYHHHEINSHDLIFVQSVFVAALDKGDREATIFSFLRNSDIE